MTAHPRRRAALVVGTLAALVLTGCGKSAPEPRPAAQDAVGGYRMTTAITSSTIAANPAGPSSQVATELYLSCADTACSTLLQRAVSTDVPQGATVRLTPKQGGYGGAHVRTGVCGGDVAGGYGESYTWSWARRSDGTLTGTLTQVFKGCDLDGTATIEATATPEKSLRLPYLPTPASNRLVTVLNAYDTELSKVYVSGAECNTAGRTTTLREAHCFARTYAAWRPDIDRLATRLAAVPGTGACATAIDAVRFRAWATAVRNAATVYAAARDAGTVQVGIKAEQLATSIATTQHGNLVTVAAMCVDPAAAGSLGDRGALGFDPTSALQPLDG